MLLYKLFLIPVAFFLSCTDNDSDKITDTITRDNAWDSVSISSISAINPLYPDTFFTQNGIPFTVNLECRYPKLGSRRYYDLVFPQIPGGNDSLEGLLGNQLEINSKLIKNDGLKGEVSLWVDSTGIITEPVMNLSIDPQLDKQILKIMSDVKWLSAYHSATGVRIGYEAVVFLTIKFFKE